MNRVSLTGQVKITHFDKTGKIISVEEHKNLIVDTGLEYMAKLLNGVSTSPFEYIALGTDNTAAESGDTGLGAETSAAGLARAQGTGSYVSDYKAFLSHTFTNTSGGTVALEEAGLFDAAVAGNMLAHRVFTSTKNIADDESILIEWTITVSNA